MASICQRPAHLSTAWAGCDCASSREDLRTAESPGLTGRKVPAWPRPSNVPVINLPNAWTLLRLVLALLVGWLLPPW